MTNGTTSSSSKTGTTATSSAVAQSVAPTITSGSFKPGTDQSGGTSQPTAGEVTSGSSKIGAAAPPTGSTQPTTINQASSTGNQAPQTASATVKAVSGTATTGPGQSTVAQPVAAGSGQTGVSQTGVGASKAGGAVPSTSTSQPGALQNPSAAADKVNSKGTSGGAGDGEDIVDDWNITLKQGKLIPGMPGWILFGSPFNPSTRPYVVPNISPAKSVDLRQRFGYLDFYDQGPFKSDVANAVCSAYGFERNKPKAEKRATGLLFDPSRAFVYYNARTASMKSDVKIVDDWGCNVRFAFRSLEEYGVCPERSCPYPVHKAKETAVEAARVDGLINAYPGADAYSTAKSEKVTKYFRLDVNRPNMSATKQATSVSTMDNDGAKVLESLRICLTDEHPVVFSFWYIDGSLKMTNDMLSPLPKAHQSIDTRSSKFAGHSVLAVGYDDDKKCVLCQDSLKERQLFWLPYGWITDWFATDDFWTLRT